MEKIGNKYKSKLIMNRKYFVTGLVFLVTAAGFAQGVQMTYEHDEAKMKQITVMESGIGALTPDWYYNTLHENYSKGAASKNKTLFRTMAGINLYNQKDMAESIDSALVKRAAVEALNIADRSGGMLDIAWRGAEGFCENERVFGEYREDSNDRWYSE